mgnify:CR=1 FL=1
MKLVKDLQKWIDGYNEVKTLADELELSFDFYKEELVTEGDVDAAYAKASEAVEALELKNMLRDEADQMEMIEHANATTIHKAQGSECPVVIIPWVKAFYMMLKRNILYTGVTRAKSKVYLVGEWAAVCQAIHTDDSGTRNTILSERIVQYYDQYQSEQKPEMEQLKLVV